MLFQSLHVLHVEFTDRSVINDPLRKLRASELDLTAASDPKGHEN